MSQSPSIYDSARIKTIASSQEKRRYVLDYRDTLSSPKIRKINEKFNSCYCWTLFDYCHICVSGLCSTHQTIKCSGECERIFHVSCTDINKIDFSKIFKTNDSSCIEIYSSVDKVKLLNTTWLCAKCKYTRYNMIETPNVEDDLIFGKKCLNVGLLMSSKISIQEKKRHLKMLIYFCPSYMLIVQKICITILLTILQNLIHPQQELQSRIVKNMLYMVDDLKLPCYATM